MALAWNGTTDQRYEVADIGAAQVGVAGMSFAGWLQWSAAPSGVNIVLNDGAVYRFRYDGSVMNLLWKINGTNQTPTYAIGAHTLGGWDHCCHVYDGSAIRLYVNNVEQANVTGLTGSVDDLASVSIGCNKNGTSPANNLRLADWAVWLRALSAGERAALASGVAAQDLAPDGWYLPMWGDQTPKDFSFRGLTVTAGTAVPSAVAHAPVSPMRALPDRWRRSRGGVLLRR